MQNVRAIKIFLSSPIDVAPEREAAKRAVARVEAIYQKHLAFFLEQWEAHFYQATRSFQETVAAMDAFDLVIGILWKRIGTELPPEKFCRVGGGPFESGTVYEIESALAAGAPPRTRPHVYVFKKTQPVFYSSDNVDEEKRQKEALDSWYAKVFYDVNGHQIAGSNAFESVDDFEDQFESFLIAWVQERGYVPKGPIWDSEILGLSPYPGLFPYDHDRENVFFGRSYSIQEAHEQLLTVAVTPGALPALFIIGASGSGKSSLARAGLLPALTTPGMTTRITLWRSAISEPSTKSIQTLAERIFRALPELASGAQSTASKWTDLAKRSPDAAVESVCWALGSIADKEQQRTKAERAPEAGLILVVDQLESLFGDVEQSAYIALLRALVISGSVWLIVTVRSDRYAELQQDSDLLFLKRSGATYDLPPPGLAEITDIIKGPARAAGLEFERKNGVSLLETLRRGIPNADALPLLQMTLAQLFEAKTGKLLTFAAYETIGGIEGAIAAHANAIYGKMPGQTQKELGNVLRALVREVSRRADGSIRFTAQSAEISNIVGGSFQEDFIRTFVDGRLLVRDGGTLRVAHEALLRRWGPASQVLEALADAELRRSRLRVGFAVAAALLFLFIAVGAILLYDRSNANLSLASRARADQFIADGMPARALLLARNVTPSMFAPIRRMLSGGDDEESIRLASIAYVAKPAARRPKVIFAIRAAASAADVSIDGKQVVAGFASGVVKLVRPNGKVISLSLNRGPILSVRFHPTTDQIIIAADTGIYLWNGTTGELEDLCAGEAELTDLAVSQVSKLAAWSAKDGSVTVLNFATGERQRFKDHSNWALSVGFSGDGKRLASGGDDGRIVVRDLAKSSFSSLFSVGHKDVWSVALSFDGAYLATASVSGPVTILDLNGDGQPSSSRVLPMSAGRRWKVRFSPDDQSVAVASWDGTVSLFNPKDLQHLGTIDGNDQRVNEVVFVPAIKAIVTASNSGAVKQWESSEIRPMFLDRPTGATEIIVAAYRSDGKQFIAGGDDGLARLYDVNPNGSFHLRCSLDVGRWISGIVFLYGGRTAVALKALEGSSNKEPPLVAFDTDACKSERRNNLPAGGDVTSIAASPTSARLAWGTGDGIIYYFNAETEGEPERINLNLPSAVGVTDINFSLDGNRLLIGTSSGAVHLLDIPTRAIREFKGPTQYVNSVKISPDGRFAAAGGRDAQIFVWKLNSPDAPPTKLDMPGGTNNLAFSWDSEILAAGSDALYISMWRIEYWKKFFVWHNQVGIRSVFDFHPTRRDLAFDGGAGVLRVLPSRNDSTYSEPYGRVIGVEPIFDAEPTPDQDEILVSATWSGKGKSVSGSKLH